MQENKFEKGVQQQVEGLRIRPSEAVWEKVEEELRKKKKRRVVFFIFLLAGLSLIGYSGYFFINQSKQNLTDQNSTLTNKNEPVKQSNSVVPNTGNTPTKQQQTQVENQSGQTGPSDLVLRENQQGQTGTPDPVLVVPQINDEKEQGHDELRDHSLNDKKKITTQVLPDKNQHRPKSKRVRFKNVEPINSKQAIAKADKISEKRLNNKAPKTGEEQAVKTEIIQGDMVIKNAEEKEKVTQPAIVQEDLQQSKQPVIEEEVVALKKDSVIEKAADKETEVSVIVKKNRTGSKINWGIELSAGVSGSRESVFSFNNNNDSQKSFAADYLASPVNNAAGGSPGIVYSPSSIQAGPAFRAGMIAELKISERSSISSGLRYAYYSNSIMVGTRDTTQVLNNIAFQNARVESFYRGFHEKKYTNRYHFIQLPVQYQLQLNKGVKLPTLLWSVGASAGYLFATNGLVYDAKAGGIHYRNNAAFNKVHFNVHTGFSVRVANKSKTQWSLGPELGLDMSNLMKDGYYMKQYLLYGGITGKIIFAKKK